MSEAVKKKYYTQEEYLALEEIAEYKSEYLRGEIFAMAGGSFNHSRIAADMISALNMALAKGDCEAVGSDTQVYVEAYSFYAYPDVSVVCGGPQFSSERRGTITNPVILVEVLSESSEKYDRGDKFFYYKGLPSFQTYILISQKRVQIDCYERQPDGKWLVGTYIDRAGELPLPSLNISLPIEKIYARVDFELGEA